MSFHSEFRKRTEMIIKLAQEVIGESNLNRRLFWGLIGIRQDDASTRNPQERQMYEEKVEIIKKEKPQLIEEMIHYNEKMIEITKRLLNKLENFLKTNNLRLEEERTYPLYRY